jgi:p-cumate 2,3-dioxygenase alpha subunit
MENATDTYHGEPTHASYVEHLARMNKEYLKEGVGEPEDSVVLNDGMLTNDLGNGHTVIETHGFFGRPIAKWHPSFGADGKREIDAVYKELVERLGPEKAERAAHWNFNVLIFPNLAIVDVHTTNIRTITPISPDEMLVRNTTIAPADETPALRRIRLSNTMEFLGPGGFGSPDDVAALEACQRGYHTKNGHEWNDISGGMKMNKTAGGELCLRTYWKRWNEVLTEGEAN